MSITVINKGEKLIRVYDNNDKVSWKLSETIVADADIKLEMDDGWHISGEEEEWGIYIAFLDNRNFLTKKGAVEFVNNDRYFKMSDIKKTWFGYTVEGGDERRLIDKKPFNARFYGFSVVDYRKEG